MRGKRTRAIKKSRGRKGTRRQHGKKIGGGMFGQSKLIRDTNELVNDTETKKLFQDAIDESNSDLNAAIIAFNQGSKRLQALMDIVIEIADPEPTTSSYMKEAEEIIRNGSSDFLIENAIQTRDFGALSTIGLYEAASQIINSKIDKYKKSANKEELVQIDKFIEQLETTKTTIFKLYETVQYETNTTYMSRGIGKYISFTGKK